MVLSKGRKDSVVNQLTAADNSSPHGDGLVIQEPPTAIQSNPGETLTGIGRKVRKPLRYH